MSNIIYKGKEAREKLLGGMKEVFDTVKVTYGANGRNVVYNKWSGVPVASNDGENIADQVIPEDLSMQQGANLIKQVARSTNSELEDGSTATIINSYNLAKRGIELVDSDNKVSPMRLRKEMKEAAKKVVEELKGSVISIENSLDLEKLAITSVEDEEIGKTIAKAIVDAGESGIVYVNESDKVGVSIEKVDGYQFNQGLVTPYLIMNPDRMETVLEDVFVLVTDIQISYPNPEFIAMVTALTKQGHKNILVICDELHPEIIKFAVLNMAHGKFNMMLVKKPMQKEYLEDIASVVGATAMTQNKGMITPKMEYLGRCKKVVCNETTTTIFKNDLIESLQPAETYVDALKNQLSIAEDEIVKTKLQERIARLTGGVYLLNVGEKTEASVKYLRDKVDDAVNSLKKVWRSKNGGIVAGGGAALYHIGSKLLKNDNLTLGEKVVYESCKSTLLQMLENGGEDKSMIEKIEENGGGYNALTMEYEPDMFKAGIVDATRVIMTSFLNSSDFASDVVTYENLVTPILDKSGLNK